MTEREQLIEFRKIWVRKLEGETDKKKILEIIYMIREINACLNEMG